MAKNKGKKYESEIFNRIEKDYIEKGLSTSEIAVKYGRTPYGIRKLIDVYGWRRKNPRSGKYASKKRFVEAQDYLLREIKQAREIERPDINIWVPENKLQKIVISNDDHIPFQNESLLKPFLNFLHDFKPDVYVNGGDFLDFPQLSKFRKNPLVERTIKEDTDMGFKRLESIREIIEKARMFLIEGNHDFRFRTYILDNASYFYDLFSLALPKLLRLENLDITYFPCPKEANRFSDNYIKIKDFALGHFDKYSKNAGYTGRLLRDEKGINVVQTHTHKLGISYRRYLDGVKFGAETGCMCVLNPTWISDPDWENGFGVLYLKGGNSTFYLVKIENNQFIFNGKLYK